MLVDCIESAIKKEVSEILNLTEVVDPQQDLRDIGLDSMGTMELIVGLEKLFHINFEDEELLISNFTTIEGIKKLINSKLLSE
ncbi:hypothetical protein A616_28855 [Brevibacillus brevis X23]|nr:hypothetical protein A616_28855 [Brevibacillus brevis X23]